MKAWIILGLLVTVSVYGLGGNARPVGVGQQTGYDHPRLVCPDCYKVASPVSGTVSKSGMSVKGTLYARGQQVVPPTYYSVTYAPGWYVGLGNYYRLRGRFVPSQSRFGADKGVSIVHFLPREKYAVRTIPGYQLVDGRMVRVG